VTPRGDLFRVEAGAGDVAVLVHGSFTDLDSWALVQHRLAASMRVVSYDRRGHSRSGPADGHGTPRVHEDDLIALVEGLDEGPVHLVGNSFGGAIALGVAARRPDLVRSVAAHEPPLVGVAQRSPAAAAVVRPVLDVAAAVERALRRGEVEAGVRTFVDDVAIGPGTWALLPDGIRAAMVANAPTFLEMLDDPAWGDVPDVPAHVPTLLTVGDASPDWLMTVTDALAEAVPHASRRVLPGAGHVPHLTHAEDLVRVVSDWCATHRSSEARPEPMTAR
jgi:pimeloyl-ACP methyl ester carboxylesterase